MAWLGVGERASKEIYTTMLDISTRAAFSNGEIIEEPGKVLLSE